MSNNVEAWMVDAVFDNNMDTWCRFCRTTSKLRQQHGSEVDFFDDNMVLICFGWRLHELSFEFFDEHLDRNLNFSDDNVDQNMSFLTTKTDRKLVFSDDNNGIEFWRFGHQHVSKFEMFDHNMDRTFNFSTTTWIKNWVFWRQHGL